MAGEVNAIPYGVTTPDPLGLVDYLLIKFEKKPDVARKKETVSGGDGKVIQESALDLTDEYVLTYYPLKTPKTAHGLVKHEAKSVTVGEVTTVYVIDEIAEPEDAEAKQQLVVNCHVNKRTHKFLNTIPAAP